MPEKFTTIEVKGKREALKIGKRGKGRVTIDKPGIEPGEEDFWSVPRSFTPDDLQSFVDLAQKCSPSWFEHEDTNGNSLAMRIEKDKVYIAKFAGVESEPFKFSELKPGLDKAMRAAGG